MKRTNSLEKVNDLEIVSNARNGVFKQNSPDNTLFLLPPRRRFKSTFANIFEHYSISVKPRLHRSSSLSDLATNASDFNLDFIQHTSRVLIAKQSKTSIYNSIASSGDGSRHYYKELEETLRVYKGKKTKGMTPESYAKFASEYAHNYNRERERETEFTDANGTSSIDNSSVSTDPTPSGQRGAAFPFKPTPSGNLKVQSNQVVFQSSTVGVLLADPTQAKVKVKFEGKAQGEGEEELLTNYDLAPQLQYGPRDTNANQASKNDRAAKTKIPGMREDKGKDLGSLGYISTEPIDWLRVQLPKKQDLFQEFYRRIHNYINTDTVVHIGDEEFHCHRIILQIYSTFFDVNPHREIELPVNNVTPEAFHTIYDWMIFSGPESNKLLKRDNVLELFCAAQYLSIKDLEEQCWSFIVNENLFTEDTAFALYRQARAKGMTPVMDLMIPRVMRFFLPLVASRDFLELEAEEVLTLLKSNYICVTSEIEVLMAGVRWLYGDWSSRRRFAVDVMRCVRFGLISPWQLVDIKRNPDNAEILELVNEAEVQQMVDDGLAYVIIKYWYGNNSKNYYHWLDVLGLSEPAERNWIGEETNHVTYKDFLKYLEQFMVPKEQMFQQMAIMQPPRRNDDVPGAMRGMDADKNMGRPKIDFPLPATLKGLTGDKDKSFPTMSEFFEHRRKVPMDVFQAKDSAQMNMSARTAAQDIEASSHMQQAMHDRRRSDEARLKQEEVRRFQVEQAKLQLQNMQQQRRKDIQHIHMCTIQPHCKNLEQPGQMYEPPEKDSSDDLNTSTSGTSSATLDTSTDINQFTAKQGEKRHSVAASYLAAATAALSGPRRGSQVPSPFPRPQAAAVATRSEPARQSHVHQQDSPQISLFNQSKESLARINMNKLSTSILGPSNKNYITEGSLFNWDRETVLVFGGIDPHNQYGTGKNNGKDIFRFDPVTNVWDFVGDLPEPRHHHSVAFLRGRVYLVGGADPRDDDIRGKSVVVSTVWSYEPVTRSWYSENGLSVPRKNFGLVVHRMALYAIGGQDKKGRVLRSVEKFDPKTGSWTEMRSMGVARMAVAAVKYRDYIWVAGGMTGEKKKPVCKIVECYNSRTNEWTEIHCLRFPRCFSTMFAMNDKLYIVGGAGKVCDKDKTASSVGAIDVWDWKDREWKAETEMSIPRHGHALAYLGTQLIIIGGVTTIYMRALSNVESFCCERRAWIRGVTPLPSPLSGHGAVTLPPASLM
ncbi:uncharacterized protein LOC126367662 [Pectinophora gossypiella]|uniref:uncharacterized protein LOC126367662 n=1 Tax=Pectinophora gossypiella TaxID=13191 RepID=UPI00214F385D|nr:uncharacterized protein LOC126367662 [Pectinophora gossypiella]